MSKNKQVIDDVEMSEEEDIYEVEELLEKKKLHGKVHYLVKWVGFSASEATWEPISNISADTIKEFEQKHAKAKQTPTSENKIDLLASTPIQKETKKKKSKVSQSEIVQTSKPNVLQPIDENAKEEVTVSELPLNEEEPKPKRRKEKKEPKQIKEDKPPVEKPSKEETNENVSSLKSQAMVLSGDSYVCLNDENKEFGSFEYGDTADKIVTAKLLKKDHEDQVYCMLQWKPRKDGARPGDSLYSNKALRELCPRLLLDFYEERLRFPSK